MLEGIQAPKIPDFGRFYDPSQFAIQALLYHC